MADETAREHTAAAAAPGIDWKAGAIAGLLAGLVFLVLEMVMVPLFLDGSPWGPPRMIGAIVLGQDVLPPPATFAPGVVMVAMILHFTLSMIYGLTLAPILSRLGTGNAAVVGLVFGLLLYVVNFYVFTAVFPWFANARNWVSIFAHAVFGLALGAFYKGMQKT